MTASSLPAGVASVLPDGTVHVVLPAGGCTACQRAWRWLGSVEVAACGTHDQSVRLWDGDGNSLSIFVDFGAEDPSLRRAAIALWRESVQDRADGFVRFAFDVERSGVAVSRPDVDVQLARALVAAFDPPLTVPSLATWKGVGIYGDEVQRWEAVGVTDPGLARGWRANGFTPETIPAGFQNYAQVQFVKAAGVPLEAAWGLLRADCTAKFAKAGHDGGHSPAEVRALALALVAGPGGVPLPKVTEDRPGYEDSDWDDVTTAAMVEAAENVMDLDWLDVAACIGIGMTVDAAAEYVRGGGEMGAVRLLAALS